MNDQFLDQLSHRLDRLETLCFVLWTALVVVSTALVYLILLRTRTRDFVGQRLLRDRAGRRRLAIGSGEGGGVSLDFFDGGGRVRLMLGLREDDNPGLSFFDRSGRLRFLAGLDDGDAAFLGFPDQDGRPRFTIAMDDQRGPTLRLSDGATPRLVLGFSPEGEPCFNLWDRTGKARFLVSFTTEGQPTLQLLGEDETKRIEISTSSSGNPALCMGGNDGRVNLWVGLDEGGVPMVQVWNENGGAGFLVPPEEVERGDDESEGRAESS